MGAGSWGAVTGNARTIGSTGDTSEVSPVFVTVKDTMCCSTTVGVNFRV